MTTKSLTSRQMEQQDWVDNEINNMLTRLIPEHEWDMEIIGDIRETIIDYINDKKIMPEMDFYPYITEEE